MVNPRPIVWTQSDQGIEVVAFQEPAPSTLVAVIGLAWDLFVCPASRDPVIGFARRPTFTEVRNWISAGFKAECDSLSLQIVLQVVYFYGFLLSSCAVMTGKQLNSPPRNTHVNAQDGEERLELSIG
jgi:hypothetical protein